MEQLNTQELAEFLEKANNSSYANKDAPKAPSCRLGSKDYHFENGDLVYHDTYFGIRDFIGEEIVYKNKTPVWGANYFGFILDPAMHEDDVYAFLRKALLQKNNETIPVRGPANFSENEWEYQFSANGELGNFVGQEEITLNEKIIYRCFIHGGFIN